MPLGQHLDGPEPVLARRRKARRGRSLLNARVRKSIVVVALKSSRDEVDSDRQIQERGF